MNSLQVPVALPPAGGAPVEADRQRSSDEEIPLGWECANPALQIERWGIEAVPAGEPAC